MNDNLCLDYVELFVSDAWKSASEWIAAYGFRPAGWRVQGGLAGTAYSLLLRLNGVALVLTSALDARHPAHDYVHAHGDGVASLALAVDDVDACYRRAVAGGARVLTAPFVAQDGRRSATLAAFGDLTHQLHERAPRPGMLPSGFQPLPDQRDPFGAAPGGGLREIDHFAVCLPHGALLPTVGFYENALGLRTIFGERTEVGSQAMDSRVVQSDGGGLTLTLIEPSAGTAGGQIADFLERHGGAGIQHIAFLTDDIVEAVDALQRAGVSFLHTPGAYYDMLPARLSLDADEVAAMRRLHILADRDDDGQLLQIFTETTHARRTLFFELIERRAARTFGSGNIAALYRAVAAEAEATSATASS
ncbi:4-hydroxyphenylpyruvate dioxygenase [Burkholderia perseverans]|uniref:4-hydroxyphenylpyruvate dioxygenase n=1 Tax=Burkholderia perseverans TaxID=2615214 RepID=UPI001FEF6DDA|nr:4-hydroxyphenylpyruvate dioxygenase [Burkholderia perseverans]